MNDKKDSLFDIITTILLFVFIGLEIFLALLALSIGGGFESEANRNVFVFSTILGLFGAIIILLLKLGNWIIKISHSENRFGFIGSIVHDPETSFIPINKKGLGWLKNPLITALAFLIPCSIFGVIQVYSNTFFTDLPQRSQQQILESASAILSTIPADLEVYLPVAICGFFVCLTTWYVKKNKLDKSLGYLIIYLGIPLFYAILWYGFHLFRYQNSSVSGGFVFLFGLLSAYLLVTFRSLIPVLILKLTNNLYLWLNGAIQSDETVLLITVGVNILIVILLVFILTFKSRKKVSSDG